MECKLQKRTDTLSPNLEDIPLSVAFPFLCPRSARLVSRRQSDIYSVTEDLVDRDNGRRCGDGGDAEFGPEKTCMSSAEFDSHLAGHRNGKAFLNGLAPDSIRSIHDGDAEKKPS